MTAKKRPTRRPQHKPSSASRLPQLPTSATLVYTEYDITDEPLDNRDIKKLPSQVQARIDDLYELAQHDPRSLSENEHKWHVGLASACHSCLQTAAPATCRIALGKQEAAPGQI
jgi:hypothetical protein